MLAATARLSAFAESRSAIVRCQLAVDDGETTSDACDTIPAPPAEPLPTLR
jgi:hypothetical protein